MSMCIHTHTHTCLLPALPFHVAFLQIFLCCLHRGLCHLTRACGCECVHFYYSPFQRALFLVLRLYFFIFLIFWQGVSLLIYWLAAAPQLPAKICTSVGEKENVRTRARARQSVGREGEREGVGEGEKEGVCICMHVWHMDITYI